MADAEKARYHSKGKLLAVIDKLTVPQLDALIDIASSDYAFNVASRLTFCDDGILAEVEDLLDRFDIPKFDIGVEVIRLNKRTAH